MSAQTEANRPFWQDWSLAGVKDLATLIMAVVIILGSFAGVVQWIVSSAVARFASNFGRWTGALSVSRTP